MKRNENLFCPKANSMEKIEENMLSREDEDIKSLEMKHEVFLLL